MEQLFWIGFSIGAAVGVIFMAVLYNVNWGGN